MANPYKKSWTETVSNRRAGCIERVHVRFGKGWSGTYLQRQRTGCLLHTRIQLQYRARSGRKTTQWHTPDFLVIRQHTAGFEEWKPAASLDTLTVTMPERYIRTASGSWQCPPGESAAQVHGLSYRVRSSSELHPLFIQNLKFLQDFWIHPFDVAPAQETQVLALLATAPGLSITQLQDACPDLPVDVLWALLTQQRIFTDLEASSLMQWDQVLLYRSPQEAEEQRRRTSAMPQPLPLFARFRLRWTALGSRKARGAGTHASRSWHRSDTPAGPGAPVTCHWLGPRCRGCCPVEPF
jgi:hypothetical protein